MASSGSITVIDGPIIRAGQTLSDAVNLVSNQGKSIAGLLVPHDMPRTYVTFQLSQGADDFRDLWSVNGYEVSIYINPGARMVFDTNWSLTADYLKIRTPEVQPVDRVFKTIIVVDPASHLEEEAPARRK